MTKSELMKKLNKLSKIELIDLILELNKKDNKVFFDVRFKSLDKKSIKTIIEGYVKKAYVRGYVPASKAQEAYEGVYIIVEKILKINSRLERIELLCYTTNIVMNIQGIDDSNGDLFTVMNQLLQAIYKEIIDRIGRHSKEESEAIIDIVFTTLKKDNYYGITDFYYETLNIITVVCSSEALFNYYEKYLDVVIEHVENSKSDYYSTYELERILLIKYHAMKSSNLKTSLDFLKANLHYHNFKKEYINYMMDVDDFENLIEYCKEVIDSGNRDLKEYTFKILIQVGEQTNNRNLIRENAFQLLLQGDYRVYEIYKETFSDVDFRNEVSNLLEYKDSPHWTIPIRNLVAIKENLQDIMIDDINENSSDFFLYYEHLNKESLIKLKDSYREVILNQLFKADKRSKYKKVCRLLEQYSKDYQEYPLEIIEDIETNHYRKTALMDEIRKLKMKLKRSFNK